MSHATQSQLNSTLHECRWAWCRRTFLERAELHHHVINDHVVCAQPIPLRDVALILRAEEGFGDSFSIPKHTGSSSGNNSGNTNGNSGTSGGGGGTSQFDQQPSSLPSPPRSDSSPVLSQPSLDTVVENPRQNVFWNPPVSPQPSTGLLFGAISSPTPSESFAEQQVIPEQPSLTALMGGSNFPPFPQDSQSSSDSRDAVEKQLTQDSDMDLEQDAAGGASTNPVAAPSQATRDDSQPQNDPHPNRTPTQAPPLHNPNFKRPAQTQQWYQPPAKHRKSRNSVASSTASSPTTSPASYFPPTAFFHQTPIASSNPHSQNIFRSGSLQIGPDSPPQHSHNRTQSQPNPSQWPELAYSPDIQTQAPYQSQPPSQ